MCICVCMYATFKRKPDDHPYNICRLLFAKAQHRAHTKTLQSHVAGEIGFGAAAYKNEEIIHRVNEFIINAKDCNKKRKVKNKME